MSFKNYEDTSPLVACYNTTSYSATGPTKIVPINANLFAGEISGGNTLTLENKASLMGDVYGYSQVSLGLWCSFHLDGVRQYQGLDVCSSISTATFKAPEQFYANSNENVQIKTEYKINSNGDYTVHLQAGYPRITGVLLK